MKKIGILGCGWLGKKIAANYNNKGWEVFVSNTYESKRLLMAENGFNAFVLTFSDNELMDYRSVYSAEKKIFDECDVIILSIPASNRQNMDSLTIKFQNIINFLNKKSTRQLFYFNSTGIYPNVNKVIDEDFSDNSLLNPNFYAIEQLLIDSFPHINVLRLAGLFGDDRVFSRYFSNKVLESGLQPVNHIHYKDIIEIIALMISQKTTGKIYNVVAPGHPTKKDVIASQLIKYNCAPPAQILNQVQDYKIVSSEKLINELPYSFLFPNPCDF